MTITVGQSKPITGRFFVPGDKSISHRALLISAIADGTSEIVNLLSSHDTQSTIHCLRKLGVEIRLESDRAFVGGKGLYSLRQPSSALNARNSGTTIRLLAGILAGQPFRSLVTGDDSLRQRPMQRIMDPLRMMGASLEGSPRATPPLTIVGKKPLTPIRYKLPVASAQVKSSILFAGLFADGVTAVIEEIPTRDHTERILGITQTRSKPNVLEIVGGKAPSARQYSVPGDFSSALFLVCAALLVPGSSITLPNVGLNSTRTKAFDLLLRLGANIRIVEAADHSGEPTGTVLAGFSPLQGSVSLDGTTIPLLLDEIPVLAATLAAARCGLQLRGAGELRKKESDRISLLTRNLRSLGIPVEEYPDGFAFESKKDLLPSKIDTGFDHRIAMAFAVSGLASKGRTTIPGAEVASVSFPGFWDILKRFQS